MGRENCNSVRRGKKRVALCKLLLSKPDLLLRDEPTNHLDAESVEWLEQFLQRFPGTVVAVTHDRYCPRQPAAGWISGTWTRQGIPWEGNYSSWLEQKEKRLEVESKQEEARIKSMKASSNGCGRTPRAGRSNPGGAAPLRELSQYEHQQRNETQEIFIRWPSASATR